MSQRWLYILFFAALVTVSYVLLRNNSSTLSKKELDTGISSSEKITGFSLTHGRQKLRFTKTDSQWILNDSFPVKPGLFELFLSTISSIEVKAPVARSTRKEILDSIQKNGIYVEVQSDRRKIKGYTIGGGIKEGISYFLLDGSKKPVIVGIPGFNGVPHTVFRMNPEYWKDHLLFTSNPNRLSIIQLNNIQKGSGILLKRESEDANWVVVQLPGGGHPINALEIAVTDLVQQFRRIPFERIVTSNPDSAKEITGNLKPDWTVVLKTFEGKQEKVLLYNKLVVSTGSQVLETDPDLAYACVEISQQLVEVKYTILDKILLNYEQLTKE